MVMSNNEAINLPPPWSPVKGPKLSDIFMSLAEKRFENENINDAPTRFMELQSRTDLPIVRFPSLDPGHKRNSAKRRKRDKQIPLHHMTTDTAMRSTTLCKQMSIGKQNDPTFSLSGHVSIGHRDELQENDHHR